jgi:hypothetical protein
MFNLVFFFPHLETVLCLSTSAEGMSSSWIIVLTDRRPGSVDTLVFRDAEFEGSSAALTLSKTKEHISCILNAKSGESEIRCKSG